METGGSGRREKSREGRGRREKARGGERGGRGGATSGACAKRSEQGKNVERGQGNGVSKQRGNENGFKWTPLPQQGIRRRCGRGARVHGAEAKKGRPINVASLACGQGHGTRRGGRWGARRRHPSVGFSVCACSLNAAAVSVPGAMGYMYIVRGWMDGRTYLSLLCSSLLCSYPQASDTRPASRIESSCPASRPGP